MISLVDIGYFLFALLACFGMGIYINKLSKSDYPLETGFIGICVGFSLGIGTLVFAVITI